MVVVKEEVIEVDLVVNKVVVKAIVKLIEVKLANNKFLF